MAGPNNVLYSGGSIVISIASNSPLFGSSIIIKINYVTFPSDIGANMTGMLL